MKTVMYSIPLGYFARNLLRTGVVEKLLEKPDIQLLIITPAFNDPEFVEEFSFDKRIHFEELHRIKQNHNIFEKIIWKVCMMAWKGPHMKDVFLYLMDLKQKFYHLFSPKFHNKVFAQYRPELLVTASPGNTSPYDLFIINEAKSNGIKTLCLVHSWDNIAAQKGMIPTRPDFLGVWNELQRQEAIGLHYYDEKQVRIVGSPNFDIYHDQSIYMSRSDFFAKMGLDENKKLITITVANSRITENTFIVDILLEALQQKRFAMPVQILCRLHPRVHPDRNRAEYGKYFNNPNVTIDFPQCFNPIMKWNPNRSEMVHLVNLIKYTDVMVNVASTTTIEAAILDTPVINLGFSTSEPEKFNRQIKDLHWKYHYKYIIERKGSYIANNKEDLIQGINNYLLNSSLHRQERKGLAQDLCYYLDGKSYIRVADFILDLVNN